MTPRRAGRKRGAASFVRFGNAPRPLPAKIGAHEKMASVQSAAFDEPASCRLRPSDADDHQDGAPRARSAVRSMRVQRRASTGCCANVLVPSWQSMAEPGRRSAESAGARMRASRRSRQDGAASLVRSGLLPARRRDDARQPAGDGRPKRSTHRRTIHRGTHRPASSPLESAEPARRPNARRASRRRQCGMQHCMSDAHRKAHRTNPLRRLTAWQVHHTKQRKTRATRRSAISPLRTADESIGPGRGRGERSRTARSLPHPSPAEPPQMQDDP